MRFRRTLQAIWGYSLESSPAGNHGGGLGCVIKQRNWGSWLEERLELPCRPVRASPAIVSQEPEMDGSAEESGGHTGLQILRRGPCASQCAQQLAGGSCTRAALH